MEATEEEEWIESPDGWGHHPSKIKEGGEKESKGSHCENDDDNECGMAMDLFADSDPHDYFDFQVRLQVPGDEEIRAADDQQDQRQNSAADDSNNSNNKININVKTTRIIRLRGFKLDSDETAKSTGVTLWQAAPRLANFLMQQSTMIANKKVLELGAGLGLCSIVAFHLGAQQVILTDGDTQALAQMRQNVETNCLHQQQQQQHQQQQDKNDASDNNNNNNNERRIECRQLIWGNSSQIDLFRQKNGLFDVILGADVIYTQESLVPLFETVAALLQKSHGRFVLSRYTKWNDVSDEIVLQAAKERNLDCITCEPPEQEGIFIFSFVQ